MKKITHFKQRIRTTDLAFHIKWCTRITTTGPWGLQLEHENESKIVRFGVLHDIRGRAAQGHVENQNCMPCGTRDV